MAEVMLQERDYALFRGLFESRLMSREHIRRLYFDGKQDAMKQRLLALKKARYIREKPREPHHPATVYLAKRGFDVLIEDGRVSDYPPLLWTRFERRIDVKETTIRHELEVMSVKTAISEAVAAMPGMSLLQFSTWPRLFSFTTKRPIRHDGVQRIKESAMKPDGFIQIQVEKEDGRYQGFFFLEVDRGSMTHPVLGSKAIGYRHYSQRGGFAKWVGHQAPFRVLVTTTTAERRNNAAAYLCTLRPPFKGQVWFAAFEDVERDPLGSIWIRPGDYASATKGTAYAPRPLHPGEVYRSNPQREQWVEQHVPKHKLLD